MTTNPTPRRLPTGAGCTIASCGGKCGAPYNAEAAKAYAAASAAYASPSEADGMAKTKSLWEATFGSGSQPPTFVEVLRKDLFGIERR